MTEKANFDFGVTWWLDDSHTSVAVARNFTKDTKWTTISSPPTSSTCTSTRHENSVRDNSESPSYRAAFYVWAASHAKVRSRDLIRAESLVQHVNLPSHIPWTHLNRSWTRCPAFSIILAMPAQSYQANNRSPNRGTMAATLAIAIATVVGDAAIASGAMQRSSSPWSWSQFAP